MNQGSTPLGELLARSRQQLTRPFSQVQRRLLQLINLAYLALMPIFLISEKMATGVYVPDNRLWLVYGFVWFTNLASALYLFSRRTSANSFDQHSRLEITLRWASVLSVMLMSFVNLIGIGNPSMDSLLTDFALAHSLVLLAGMVLGRLAMGIWTAVVLGVLVYTTFVQLGYHYQFHYLTPGEVRQYEQSLDRQQPWALRRQAELKRTGLNPPAASRYFNTWLIFILVAAGTAYFFAGVARDLSTVIPQVADDMNQAIEATKEVEKQRLIQEQEILSTELRVLRAQVNPHFLYNTLNHFYIRSLEVDPELADSIVKLSDIMRYSMRDDFQSAALTDEINYMEQYISLHQLRYPLHVDFQVTGDPDQQRILPLLLIGLVENAFKHGTMSDPNHPLIIRLHIHDDRIEFFSSNLKNKKQRVNSNQIGLTNMQQRLERAYQHQQFRIDQSDDVFSCHLIIYTQS
ncbi:sensor histidine kinase [Spirosoma fluminis]